MAGINIVVAETDEEARRLFTTVQQSFTNLVRGRGGQMQPPLDDIEKYWDAIEKFQASRMLKYSVVGSPSTVRKGLEEFVAITKVDELMIVTSIHDLEARIRSYELLAETWATSS
jgi:alkanesulfonate monooxygenase SsuD/methylene tetrahydromethanopterin reductase-like flavin-dependent oxidoreductase (luciferase family)